MSRVTQCVRWIGSAQCRQPVPEARQKAGPFLCDGCYRVVNREVDGVYTAWVPMVADVLAEMRCSGCSQAAAVRRLGGIP